MDKKPYDNKIDDHDQASSSTSLGSVFIYKRFNSIEDYNDVLVAEYTGRPSTAEEFYENVRKLVMYYNAKLLYENQNKGLFTHFANKRCDYLLVDQPEILNDIIKVSKVQRRKGVHMPTQLKNTAIIWLRDWLIEEYAPGKKQLHKIFSEPLLEELIKYNDKGNFDRVSALIVLMVLLQEYQRITVKNIEKEERKMIFSEPLFTADYFNRDNSSTGIFSGL